MATVGQVKEWLGRFDDRLEIVIFSRSSPRPFRVEAVAAYRENEDKIDFDRVALIAGPPAVRKE